MRRGEDIGARGCARLDKVWDNAKDAGGEVEVPLRILWLGGLLQQTRRVLPTRPG